MKILSPALQAHLDSGATTLCWCWRLTRADGVVMGFTDHDRPLTFDATTFEPDSGLTAAEVRAGSALEVDAQDAEGVLTSVRITETDILDGRWDNATVELWRVNWSATAERVLMRYGALGEVRRGVVAFTAEVRSLAHLLNQPVGRVYQAQCDAALADARCGVNLATAAFRGTGTVNTILRDRAFIASGLGAFADAWFELGILTWTSGPNAGRRAEVLRHDRDANVRLTLLEAPLRPLAAGHAFEVTAGCDKRLATCAAKFANTLRFRGFPHIPGNDTMVRYPRQSGEHSGEVL